MNENLKRWGYSLLATLGLIALFAGPASAQGLSPSTIFDEAATTVQSYLTAAIIAGVGLFVVSLAVIAGIVVFKRVTGKA